MAPASPLASTALLAKINFPREALIVSGVYQTLFNAAIKLVGASTEASRESRRYVGHLTNPPQDAQSQRGAGQSPAFDPLGCRGIR